MMLSGLERQVLEAAALGRVVEEPDSAPAVGVVYRGHGAEGMLSAEWFGDDLLPLQVELTAAGRMLLRSR
ncbi:hypothetical protein FHR75_004185 [Kineococcus radiotolerans]|uniref:Uncharacterized protein n=1 Tax=Kineococcus radiotolerans TaxID=131568 RepID=A0A7W4TRF0_KINRA|nr:hypothetical protein [Kineococcus radiotolerans]MBB2903343.1 hypothetical protein [Kineococcus radiotolerans]